MSASVSDIGKALLQLVSCLGLAWLLYEQYQPRGSVPDTQQVLSREPDVQESSVAPFRLDRSRPSTGAALNEITARPLFYSTRRPVGPVQSLADSEPMFDDDFDWNLTGIITGDNLAMAIFKRGSDETRTLKTGMKLDGWTIKTIDANGVTLQHDDETKRVALSGKDGARQAPGQVNSSTVLNKPQYRRVIKSM